MRHNDRCRAGEHPRRERQRRDPPIDGPHPTDIGEVLSDLLDGNPHSAPHVAVVQTLQEAGITFPITVGDRRIIAADVAHGQPQHGAMRSDDHISRYEVEYCEPCPEDDCHSEVTRYEYSAHHNIAGSEKKYCPRCETIHHSEDWG